MAVGAEPLVIFVPGAGSRERRTVRDPHLLKSNDDPTSVAMKRVLITGMSGTGKSTVVAALAARGHKAVDADESGLSELVSVPERELTGLGPGKTGCGGKTASKPCCPPRTPTSCSSAGVPPTRGSSIRSSTTSCC